MTLTPKDLAEIEARVKAATEGPWNIEDEFDFVRQDAPILIAALKEAWEKNERLKKTIAFWENEID